MGLTGSQHVRLLILCFIKGLWIRDRLRLTAGKTVNWSAVCLNVYIKLTSFRVPSQRTDSRPAFVCFYLFLAQSNADPSSAADRQNSTIADKQSRWRRKTDVRAKAGSSIALHGFNISTKRVYGSQLERFRSPPCLCRIVPVRIRLRSFNPFTDGLTDGFSSDDAI